MTFLGGLLVGVLASFSTKWFTHPPLIGLPATVPFLVLIVMLLVIPKSKLPGSQFGRKALVASVPKASRRVKFTVTLVAGVGLLLVPQFVGARLPVWTTGVAYVLVFASLSLLTWGSGQISLCHAAFLALGTTTMARLTAHHVPWLLALLLAGLSVVPAGAVVAIPAIRLSGLYLALATLGFGIFMQDVVYPSGLMFGNSLNAYVPRPHLGPIDATSDKSLYYAMLAVVTILVVLILGIQRGRFGRLLRALAESPTMLSTHGLGVNLTRVLVFCLSAFFAGVAGALAVTETGVASGLTFGPVQSLLLLAVLGLCGTGRIISPILAALLYGVLPGYATGLGADRQLVLFGGAALIAAVVLARRASIASWFGRVASESDFRRRAAPVIAPWRTRTAAVQRRRRSSSVTELFNETAS
jgi:ABC-type branched-subunit amino acid transport system permease subunit